jgi:hypothetical protein
MCSHYYQYTGQHGATSTGTCLKCGDTREDSNSFDYEPGDFNLEIKQLKYTPVNNVDLILTHTKRTKLGHIALDMATNSW